MRTRNRSAGAPGLAGSGQAMDGQARVSISLRIWIALAAMSSLLIYTGSQMFQARGELEKTNAALRQAQSKANEAELVLKHALDQKEQALADKTQIMKELSAQGNRLAEFSQGEEEAKSALAIANSGSEAAQKQISALMRNVADLQKSLAVSRTGRSKLKTDVDALKTGLRVLRTQLENAEAELQGARAAAQPYRAPQ